LYFSFQTRNEITITPVAAQPVKAKEEVVLVVRLKNPLFYICYFFYETNENRGFKAPCYSAVSWT
jgi:hypothetical protein